MKIAYAVIISGIVACNSNQAMASDGSNKKYVFNKIQYASNFIKINNFDINGKIDVHTNWYEFNPYIYKYNSNEGPNPTRAWDVMNLNKNVMAQGYYGSNIIVANIDGLANCLHDELINRCSNASVNYFDINNSNSSNANHGTHTAGIMAGRFHGIASQAKVLNYQIFDGAGYIPSTYADSITVQATYFNDSYSKGARVVNMSYGTTGGPGWDTHAAMMSASGGKTSLNQLYTLAAGNDGFTNMSSYNLVTKGTSFKYDPLYFQKIIIVGAYCNFNGYQSGGAAGCNYGLDYNYSNRPGTGYFAIDGKKIFDYKSRYLMAPGSWWSSVYDPTNPGMSWNSSLSLYTGTSMAAPSVAGIAALIWARWPTLTPVSMSTLLFKTAKDLGAPGVDPIYGNGLIDIKNAFKAQGVIVASSPAGTFALNNNVTSTGILSKDISNNIKNITVFDQYGRDFKFKDVTMNNIVIQKNNFFETSATKFNYDKVNVSGYFKNNMNNNFEFLNYNESDYFVNNYKGLRMGLNMNTDKYGSLYYRNLGNNALSNDFINDSNLKEFGYLNSYNLLNNHNLMAYENMISENQKFKIYSSYKGRNGVSLLSGDDNKYASLNPLSVNNSYSISETINGPISYSFGGLLMNRINSYSALGLSGSFKSESSGVYDTFNSSIGVSKNYNFGLIGVVDIGSLNLTASTELTSINSTQNSLVEFKNLNVLTYSAYATLPINSSSNLNSYIRMGISSTPGIVSGSMLLNYSDKNAFGGLTTISDKYNINPQLNKNLNLSVDYGVNSDNKSLSLGYRNLYSSNSNKYDHGILMSFKQQY